MSEGPKVSITVPDEDFWDGDLGQDRVDCWYCAGEGIKVCDGGTDCPEADDAGCPFTDFHTYRCDQCDGHGSWLIEPSSKPSAQPNVSTSDPSTVQNASPQTPNPQTGEVK